MALSPWCSFEIKMAVSSLAECRLAGRSLREHEGCRVGLERAPGETVKVGRNSGFAVAIRQQSVDVEPILEQMGKGARL